MSWFCSYYNTILHLHANMNDKFNWEYSNVQLIIKCEIKILFLIFCCMKDISVYIFLWPPSHNKNIVLCVHFTFPLLSNWNYKLGFILHTVLLNFFSYRFYRKFLFTNEDCHFCLSIIRRLLRISFFLILFGERFWASYYFSPSS